MTQRRFRRRKPKFKLFSAPNGLGASSVIRLIAFDEGMELVDLRKAERLYYAGTDVVNGFRLSGERAAAAKVIVVMPPKPSSSVFSRRENDAIVGLLGESRTMNLSDEDRKARVAEGLPAMDEVEAARLKFEVYQEVH